MTGALAAAWPEPLFVMLVAIATGLFLAMTAFRESISWAHAASIPALALAAVVAVHGLAGRWGEPLAGLLGSAASGGVLVGFALGLAAWPNSSRSGAHGLIPSAMHSGESGPVSPGCRS